MKRSPFKNYLSYLPVITIAVGMILSWAKFQAQAENTTKKVDKLETKLEEADKETDKEISELKDDNTELDKSLEVSKVQQEAIKKDVQQISEKTDKILDLLVEMKSQKR